MHCWNGAKDCKTDHIISGYSSLKLSILLNSFKKKKFSSHMAPTSEGTSVND